MKCSLLLALLLAGITSSEIPLADRRLDVRTVDVSGDGRLDLLVATLRGDGTREIRIHLQSENGRFEAEPARTVSIKKDIVAWSTGDVHDDPGAELLLFTGRSCFSYRTAEQGYRKAAARVCAFEFLCDVADVGELPYLECALDLDGDGVPELLLPGTYGFTVFRRGDGGYRSVGTVPARVPDARPGAEERGHKVSFSFGPRRPTVHHDTVLKEPGGTHHGPLLESAHWLPAIAAARIDGDARRDLVFVDERTEPPTLVVHRQSEDGTFASEPSLRVPVPTGKRLRIADVDGDDRDDLIAHESEGADVQNLRIHRNDDGKFETKTADQLIRIEALGLRFELVDLDGKPGRELAITSYGIASKLEALTGAVERKLLVYRRDDSGKRLFERRPALARTEKLTAASMKSFDSPLDVTGDLDGSGINDLVLVNEDGALVAHGLSSGLKLASAPYRTHVPAHRIQRFEVVDLDGDGHSDLVLHMRTRLQILVSP